MRLHMMFGVSECLNRVFNYFLSVYKWNSMSSMFFFLSGWFRVVFFFFKSGPGGPGVCRQGPESFTLEPVEALAEPPVPPGEFFHRARGAPGTFQDRSKQ